MDADALIRKYPKLYHMADKGAYAQIERYGLLSSEAMLNLLQKPDEDRTVLLNKKRLRAVTLTHSAHGSFVLRDQRPIKEKLLGEKLEGLTAPDYFKKLNERVFLWATRKRLETMLDARPYRNSPHLVFAVDTARFVARYWDKIELASHNTGSVLFPNVPSKTPTMFSRLLEYDEQHGRRPVVEVTLKYSIPDFLQYVTSMGLEQSIRANRA